ncbi:MAG: hypothetical protein JEZ06_15915 [Anaerolineaceae bacterium]|nr:hypothetical protein [Anaerolineaceae bacterium]
MIEKGYIVIYIQSSYTIQTNGYAWTYDFEQARKDIVLSYNEVAAIYNIEPNIISGGFSGGAMASINLAMYNLIPLKGIISLCPQETPDTTSQNIKDAAQRGIKVVLMEGENEGILPFHQTLFGEFEKSGLEYQFIQNPNIGHSIPKDISIKTKQAIDFINGK